MTLKQLVANVLHLHRYPEKRWELAVFALHLETLAAQIAARPAGDRLTLSTDEYRQLGRDFHTAATLLRSYHAHLLAGERSR